MLKKLAVIGTVGIPAKYGGFETLAENLTKFLHNDFDITVFCSSKNYSRKLDYYNGSRLAYLPLNANGISSVVYDIISIFKALRFADVLLILGVSGCIVLPFIKVLSRKKIIVNIDGIEWKRAKWNAVAKIFLRYSEKIAVKYADQVITDNKVIQDYVLNFYKAPSALISYGADHVKKENLTAEFREKYKLSFQEYAFSVCRIEPENNVHIILESFAQLHLPLIFVGNWDNSEYGRKLRQDYQQHTNILLMDPIYVQNELDLLRCHAKLYLHGHSAGGTNPSLVEAMYLGLPVISYDVAYNRSTTENKALYFRSAKDIVTLINENKYNLSEIGRELHAIAREKYTWGVVTGKYRELILTTLE